MNTNSDIHNSPTWVIRAGKKGSARNIFINSNRIVLSDDKLGDLRLLPKERSVFKGIYASLHPEKTQAAIGGISGKFFRFLHEVKIDDLIIYPCIREKKIYLGKVTSSYSYDLSLNPLFPHQRSVSWIISFPKESLSLSAQRELGAARTFFRFKTHVAEVQNFLDERSIVEAAIVYGNGSETV